MPPVNRRVSPYARKLRQGMTDVETVMWQALRNRQLGGFKFRRQASIGPYIVDFLSIERMLVVELDGGQHDEGKDKQRTAFLEAEGYRVIRFWNHEVVENCEGVLASILNSLEE